MIPTNRELPNDVSSRDLARLLSVGRRTPQLFEREYGLAEEAARETEVDLTGYAPNSATNEMTILLAEGSNPGKTDSEHQRQLRQTCLDQYLARLSIVLPSWKMTEVNTEIGYIQMKGKQ